MFDAVFISEQYGFFNQYLTYQNLFLVFLMGVTIAVILILISDLISDKNNKKNKF